MSMKNFIALFVFLITLISCEEVVNLDLPSGQTRLVIEASIQKIVFEDSAGNQPVEGDDVLVEISQTTDFNDLEPAFINDAVVSITDLTNGVVYPLENFSDWGEYGLLNPIDFVVQDDVEYRLRIEYDGEVFEATETLNVSTPINNIEQFKNTNSNTISGLKIGVSFTDLEEPDNFYIVSFDDFDFITIDDEFLDNSNPFNLEYFYDEELDIEETKDITISVWGSDREFSTFIDAISELVDGGQNGPFSTVPFQIRGNIVNTTNSDNFPFGYFRIHETYSKQVTLISNDLAPEEEEN